MMAWFWYDPRIGTEEAIGTMTSKQAAARSHLVLPV
jgi:hypothetical protein